jgi:hypothetical protein
MAVAGGIVSDVGGLNDGVPIMVGVAFSGEGVRVASTILGKSVATEMDADKAMQEVYTYLIEISVYGSGCC